MRPECESAARRWRLSLPRRALSGAQGDLRARGVGSSVEFETHRGFAPGDDPRRVDWRVFARTERLQVRLSRAEVAPAVDVIIDDSASMGITERKARATRDLADAVGSWGRAGGMRARLLRADGGTVADGACIEFGGEDRDLVPRMPLRPQGIRVVISDFLWPGGPLDRVARVASGAAHLYVVQLLDPDELDPRRSGSLALIDCESGATLETTLDAARLLDYRARLDRLCRGVDEAARRLGSRAAMLVAGEPDAMFRALAQQGVVEPS